MLKVGVFGDSFGYEDSIFSNKSVESRSIGKSWVTLLRDHVNIDNYCKPGSDLYFSYKNFIENYQKFDKNIFLITNFNRFSFKFQNGFVHAHSFNSAKSQLKNNIGEKQRALKASMDYFLYLQDDEKDIMLRDLFINDIVSKSNNTIFINCFGANSLNEIMQQENQVWNLPSRYTFNEKFIDIRKSHLTNQNNEILFGKVLKYLLHDDSLTIKTTDFYVPSLNEKELYIIKSL